MLFTPVKFSILFHYQISIFFSPYSISARTNSSGRYMFVVTGIIFLRITHYIHFQRQPLFSFLSFYCPLIFSLPYCPLFLLRTFLSIFQFFFVFFLPSFLLCNAYNDLEKDSYWISISLIRLYRKFSIIFPRHYFILLLCPIKS